MNNKRNTMNGKDKETLEKIATSVLKNPYVRETFDPNSLMSKAYHQYMMSRSEYEAKKQKKTDVNIQKLHDL